jgi:hypothetical protein
MKRTANPLSSTDNPATSSLVEMTKTPSCLSDGFATVCLIVPMDLMKVNEYNLQVGFLQIGNLQVRLDLMKLNENLEMTREGLVINY